jgi:RNA polymerase sigma-70 factor (ECF subfamily)
LKRGDKVTDFNEIYQKYYPDVYKFLLSLCADEYLAQDLAAETFLKAVTGIEKFRGECALYTWLCRIAKNLYYDYLKKQKHTVELNESICAYGDSPEILLITKEQVSNVINCLHTIDEPYKEVFMLHIFAQVPLVEISRIFGKSESWARVTFYRAKSLIIQKLKERNQYE